MAGKSGAIKAGRAFVELFADDSALVRGLKKASDRLKRWGSSIRGLGSKFVAFGGVVAGVLGAAAAKFAAAGDELDKMSARTGVSVEMLSKLGFAAEQSGADMGTLEKGLGALGRFMTDIEFGTKKAADVMGALGLSMDALSNKTPDERIKILLKALSGIEDPSLRAGLAMQVLGRAGRQLLPMAAGFEGLSDEAEKLGLVITKDQATAAANLADAWNRLKRQLGAAVVQIGSALVPAFLKIQETISPIISKWIAWAKANSALIVTIVKIAGIVAAVGAGLIALGSVLSGIGGIVGLAASAWTFLGTAIGAVGAILGALMSPIGLVLAGIAALSAFFVDWSTIVGEATSFAASEFSSFKDRALESWGGIRDAIASGDLALAFKIVVLTLKAEWARLVGAVKNKWAEWVHFFKSIWSDAVFAAAGFFINAWSEVQKVGVKTWDVIRDAFDVFTTALKKGWNSTVGFFKKAWSKLKATVTGSEDKSAEIDKETAQLNAAADRDRNRRILQRERERKAALAGIEQRRSDIQSELEDAQKAADADRQAALNAELEENDRAIAAAKEELERSIADAAKKRKAAEETGDGEAPTASDRFNMEKFESALDVTQKKTKASVDGSFSVFQAMNLGGGGISAADRTAKATEETAKNTRETRDAIKYSSRPPVFL